VALALVREVIERVIPNPQPEDIKAIKREAFDAVVRLGAAAENVEVTIEVNPHTQRVRATAMGASEMRAKTRTTTVSEGEALAIAAKSMGVPVETTNVAAATDRMRIIQSEITERHLKFFTKKRYPVRAVDLEGVIRVQRSDAKVLKSSAQQGLEVLKRFWEDTTIYNGDSVVVPDMFVVVGAHIVDLTGIVALNQALAIARTEFEGLAPEVSVVFISVAGMRR
jgi:hypothetical protein